MNFSEAMDSMKNGEKIRRSTWKENAYVYFNTDDKCFSNESNSYILRIDFNKNDFFANDWEIYKGREFYSGLIVEDEDGICGIILDVYEESIHVLNENGLVEELLKNDVEIISDERETLYKPLLNKLQSYSKSKGE